MRQGRLQLHYCHAKPHAKVPSRSTWSYLLPKGETDTDERYTPQWVVDLVLKVMGRIDLDPCADPLKRIPATVHFTEEDNGLERAWGGKVFLNPPYSGCATWIKHLDIYATTGAVTEAILLVPVTTMGTKGACMLMRQTASAVTIFDRSLNFLGEDYQPMPSKSPIPLCLIYVGENTDRFLNLTRDHGYQLLPHKPHSGHKQRQCCYCGKQFIAKRSTAKFCGSTCRKESHRKNAQSKS